MLQNIPNYSKIFQDIPKNSTQNIPEHSKLFQNIPKHSKTPKPQNPKTPIDTIELQITITNKT